MKSSPLTLKHTLPRPKGLIECDYVADIGAGIRPFNWYKPKRLICVEPYRPYVEKLRSANYDVIPDTAIIFLSDTYIAAEDIAKENPGFTLLDSIYMLDVVEHMEKEEGQECLDLAMKVAEKQVVIFTPNGFVEQTEDEWGLGGEYWQTHRSGWTPDEFPGWDISFFDEGFFAIWTNTHN